MEPGWPTIVSFVCRGVRRGARGARTLARTGDVIARCRRRNGDLAEITLRRGSCAGPLAVGVLLAVGVACGGDRPSAPPPPPARAVAWTVRPAAGVRYATLTIACPGRVQAEQDVDEADALRVAPGCRATAEIDGRSIELRLPPGDPAEVRCGADGACVRASG